MEDEILTPPTPTMFRFPDEATGMAALDAAGLIATDEDGNQRPITASHHHALDIVATISKGGEWDPETGEVITPPTVIDGWHVNYLGPLPDGWEQYAVWPRNPTRQWATASPPLGEGYVRARDEEGKFLPDDPATPDVNEAWVKV
jgi:hypothetical protein